jgi:hypothetical protein
MRTDSAKQLDGYKKSSTDRGGSSRRHNLIHGAIDDNVHVNTISLSRTTAGGEFQLMLYPNHARCCRSAAGET